MSVFEETTAPNDFGFVRCSLYYTTVTGSDISTSPWKSIGATAGGDDLIALGSKGHYDYGLCYAAPPIVHGDKARFYYCAPTALLRTAAKLYY